MKAHASEGAIVKARIFEGAVVKALVSEGAVVKAHASDCLLYTSPSPRDGATSRMPSSA